MLRACGVPRCASTQPLATPQRNRTLPRSYPKAALQRRPGLRTSAAACCTLGPPHAVPLHSPTRCPLLSCTLRASHSRYAPAHSALPPAQPHLATMRGRILHPCSAPCCAHAQIHAVPLPSSTLLPIATSRYAPVWPQAALQRGYMLALAQPHNVAPLLSRTRRASRSRNAPTRLHTASCTAHLAPMCSRMLHPCNPPCGAHAHFHAAPLRSPTLRPCAVPRCPPVQPHLAPLRGPRLCSSADPHCTQGQPQAALRSRCLLRPSAAPHCSPILNGTPRAFRSRYALAQIHAAPFAAPSGAHAQPHTTPLRRPMLRPCVVPHYAYAQPHATPMRSSMLPLSAAATARCAPT